MSTLQDITIQALDRPASQQALEYEHWYTWGDLRRMWTRRNTYPRALPLCAQGNRIWRGARTK